VKGAEFEISDSLGYHQITFLESHLQGEISGFLCRLYFIQIAGKIEAFFCLKKNIPPLAEYRGYMAELILINKMVRLIKKRISCLGRGRIIEWREQ